MAHRAVVRRADLRGLGPCGVHPRGDETAPTMNITIRNVVYTVPTEPELLGLELTEQVLYQICSEKGKSAGKH
jgi:hypothetical protein